MAGILSCSGLWESEQGRFILTMLGQNRDVLIPSYLHTG